MTHTDDDILGLDRCMCRRSAQDDVDQDVWAWLESRHPGLLKDVHEKRAPGERLHIPRAIERPRNRAMRLDDGKMTIGRLAVIASVSYVTARRARHEESRG